LPARSRQSASSREVRLADLVGYSLDWHPGVVQSDCKFHFLVHPWFDWLLPQVQNKMLAATHDSQVLDVVVEWVAVNVMDDLSWFERAAQVPLHAW
jgi:hypothetical protein